MILFFLFASLFQMTIVNANTEPTSNRVSYSGGDHLFNWASYLNLRSEPHQDAKVLAMVPKGSILTIAETQDANREFATTLIPDFSPAEDPYTSKRGEKIFGRWVKVNYEGFEGYVFDGYLSRMIPMKKSSKKSPGEIFKNYLIKNYNGAILTEPSEGEIFNEKVITPKGDKSYTHYFNYDCEVFELSMDNVGLQEALMIMTKVFKVDGVNHREDGKYYLIDANDPYTQLIVEQTEKGARISIWFCEGC